MGASAEVERVIEGVAPPAPGLLDAGYALRPPHVAEIKKGLKGAQRAEQDHQRPDDAPATVADLRALAAKVDAQNASDPLYEKLTPGSIALKAARALIFEGVTQPNGYTEPLLHKFRQEKKAAA